MSNAVAITGIELVPVLELQPYDFATQPRESPTGAISEVPDEWFRYWSDSLADSGITELRPLCPGSWHVPTANFEAPANLLKFLEVTIENWGGISVLSDPDCQPVLNGGLALWRAGSELLIEPGCCADLGDASNWREAAGYRGDEWQMLWIGHPWVSIRYEEPRLIFSDLHESAPSASLWSVDPDELLCAVVAAETELNRFARQISPVLTSQGFDGDAEQMGRRLAGLNS